MVGGKTRKEWRKTVKIVPENHQTSDFLLVICLNINKHHKTTIVTDMIQNDALASNDLKCSIFDYLNNDRLTSENGNQCKYNKYLVSFIFLA